MENEIEYLPQEKNAFYELQNGNNVPVPVEHYTDISILTSENMVLLFGMILAISVLFSAFNWAYELSKIGDKRS